jgi:hypothetical protein
MADQSSATAPAMWGVAMEVPLAVVYAVSEVLLAERVPVPGAVISGFIRLLPSIVTGPRNSVEASIQRSDCIGSRIKRRRIDNCGTGRASIACCYHHHDAGCGLRFDGGLQTGHRTTFLRRTTPGVNCNIGRFSRVALTTAAIATA